MSPHRRKLSEHERHDRELEALRHIAQILTTQAAQQDRLEGILDELESHLDMRRGTLMLLSVDGTKLHFEVAKDVNTPDAEAVSYQAGEGVNGRVLQNGQPVVIPRISQEPDFGGRIHRRGEEEEECGFICVPVTLGTEVLGTLSVDLPYFEGRQLDEDQRVLEVVSSMIAYDLKMRRVSNLQRQAMVEENRRLQSQLGDRLRPENMIGASDRMKKVYERINQVAPANTTVMIRGESGTGKELVASAIHYASVRSDKPFVKVNCAALSESLLESELFGHEKGAFTGAHRTRVGRLEQADGGTLFLDEIGDFPLQTQVKLLRLLQEKEWSRVGSNTVYKADVRFIVATNRDLEKAVETTEFRQDLYYRINVFPVFLPPLRERREDILILANHFIEEYAEKMEKPIRRISTTAINMLMAYHWPGNVRELENCIEHAVLLCPGEGIQGSHLPPTLALPGDGGENKTVSGSFTHRVEQLERDLIVDALKRTKGNVSAAARELGVTARIVRYKVSKLNIDPDRIFPHA